MDSSIGSQEVYLTLNRDLASLEEHIEQQFVEITMRLTEIDMDGRSSRLGRSSPDTSRRPKSAKGRQRDYGYEKHDGWDYGNFETQFEMERDLEGKERSHSLVH